MRDYVSLGSIKQLLLRPHLALRIPAYLHQFRSYRKLEIERTGRNAVVRFYPCLTDDIATQSGQSVYFYQDCWAARQVFREQPQYLVDLGSTVLLVGILSQYRKCISIDVRPIKTGLEGLDALQGLILELPFRDNVLPCLTTMCVLEHVGLGRYGDPLNPAGTLDAVREIARVIAPAGIVIYSVPVGKELNEFNAHRRFTYQQAADFFKGWELLDSCVLTPEPVPYVSEESLLRMNDPVACFCYRKPISDNAIEMSN